MVNKPDHELAGKTEKRNFGPFSVCKIGDACLGWSEVGVVEGVPDETPDACRVGWTENPDGSWGTYLAPLQVEQ